MPTQQEAHITEILGDNKLMMLRYDTQAFPFAWAMRQEAFFGLSLSGIHHQCIKANIKKGRATPLTAADMQYFRHRMRNVSEEGVFYRLYHRFVRQVVAPCFGDKISYTQHPEMRVHLAGTPACSAWHTDVEVTKRIDQINVWLPLVDTHGTNTLWIETDYGLKDYRPIPVRYGEALLFDGSCLGHGTVRNESDKTRVSLDFRLSVKTYPTPKHFLQLIASRPHEPS
ncbi:MAG: hypothetical protein OXE99_08875, partial [Cellvibrionales bacterium]|nr:hypothetical protein [Cellvibrionales bacterium]